MKSLFRPIVAVVLAVASVVSASASDANGIWVWTQKFGSGEREARLTIVVKGKRVVGSLTSPGPRGEHTVAELKDGEIEYDTITFSTERDINGQKFVTKFRGKVYGTFITGTIESPGPSGLSVTRDWTARRTM